MGSTAYRTHATNEKDAPPRELVYSRSMSGRTGGTAVAMFQLFSVPLVVAALLSIVVNEWAGLIGLLGSTAFGIWWWKRRPTGEHRLLRVDGGALEVWTAGGKKRLEHVLVASVSNVELEIKEIKRVQEGDSAIPAVRFINSTVAPPVDLARVILALENGRVIRLGEEYYSHSEATEWVGKMRVLLRKNGWLPKSERAAESSSDSLEADDDDDDESDAGNAASR